MAYIIWTDENGKEIHKEKKGKGRPPRGAIRGEDGNFYVKQQPDVDLKKYYIVVDAKGNVLEKVQKSRGRAKPGFKRGQDGNWYKEEAAPVAT